MRIALIVNETKQTALQITEELIRYLSGRGHDTVVSPEIAERINIGSSTPAHWDTWLDMGVNMLIVLGGDGTLLNASKRFAPYALPTLGINLGRLGFLTELEIDELWEELPTILDGNYRTDNRRLLSARVIRQNIETGHFYALNDIVVNKGAVARMIRLNVHVGTELLGSWPGDGIIAATATGSTAYSLAAGGPIVAPDLDVCLVTPICPHTLQARPFVISGEKELIVTIDPENTVAYLTSDGQDGMPLEAGDRVLITLSQTVVPLIRRHNHSFYRVLQDKLAYYDHDE